MSCPKSHSWKWENQWLTPGTLPHNPCSISSLPPAVLLSPASGTHSVHQYFRTSWGETLGEELECREWDTAQPSGAYRLDRHRMNSHTSRYLIVVGLSATKKYKRLSESQKHHLPDSVQPHPSSQWTLLLIFIEYSITCWSWVQKILPPPPIFPG